MTKKLLWLGVALAALISFRSDLFARVTGTSGTGYETCWGGDGEEVCVDGDGNLLPTTDNDTTLGTSSLRWATAYILDITVGDDLTVTDDATVSDDLTVTGDSFKTMVATITVANSDTISVAGACGGIIRLTSANSVTAAGFTTPASANAGCVVYIVNVAVPGGGTINIATSATFIAPSGGGPNVAGSTNPGILLGTNDAIIIGQIGSAWVALSTFVINN